MTEPTKRERVQAEERKRDLYFQLAQERRAAGDLAGFTAANRAAGQAVTMIHRIAEIGICSVCGALDIVEWLGVADDHDSWHCHNCGHRWQTPHGLKPTEI